MSADPKPLPPPAPPLWAPRLRAVLTRYFTWMDRRLAARLSRAWLLRQDEVWREQYRDWWMEHGWRDGADPPDLAAAKLRAARRTGGT